MRAWLGLFGVSLVLGVFGCGGGGAQGECGDAVVEGNEECDSGESNSDTAADACRLDCSNATCGDDVVDTGEECDGANQCDDSCTSQAVCGDDIVGGSEECDGTPGCNAADGPDPCRFKTTAFRLSRLTLSDPASSVVSLANPLINDAIQMDADEDGALDLNLLLLAKPLNQGAGQSPRFEFVSGDCTAPLDEATTCSAAEGSAATMLTLANEDTAACFEPDNTMIYSSGGICPSPSGDFESACPFESLSEDDMCPPAPGVDFGSLEPGAHGCFHTQPTDFALSLGTLQIPLQGASIAGQYDGAPATGLLKGVLRGFLTVEVAESTRIPGSIDTLGGSPISFLYTNDVLDLGPDGVTKGWWVHAILEADVVGWRGSALCGNGTVDEGEACDPAITSGEGTCLNLSDCEAMESSSCEQASLVNGDPCNPTCKVSTIGADDATSDGCCGLGVVDGWKDTALDDPDCPSDTFSAVAFCGGV